MAPDLSWLIGRRLHSVSKKDYTWFFVLDDQSHVASESSWRLLTERVAVTSEDHGHQFGLPAPVDAADVVRESVGDSPVDRFELNDRTGDLGICFKNGVTLQFLTLSCGYEGWRIIHHNHEMIFCTGGGKLAIFDG
jgi:hypothetical protein